MEKYLEKDKKMFTAFIDMEKAYDKVWRADLWATLKGYGVRVKLHTWIHKVTVQREQGLCKSGRGFDGRIE